MNCLTSESDLKSFSIYPTLITVLICIDAILVVDDLTTGMFLLTLEESYCFSA